jgi:hypothetical protein
MFNKKTGILFTRENTSIYCPERGVALTPKMLCGKAIRTYPVSKNRALIAVDFSSKIRIAIRLIH